MRAAPAARAVDAVRGRPDDRPEPLRVVLGYLGSPAAGRRRSTNHVSAQLWACPRCHRVVRGLIAVQLLDLLELGVIHQAITCAWCVAEIEGCGEYGVTTGRTRGDYWADHVEAARSS
ncbi:MAG: hypothetical protein DDT21_02429 [Syntrophomonadaceae bacterium]|nr:hypothetical protein [Bacillota bacterium]